MNPAVLGAAWTSSTCPVALTRSRRWPQRGDSADGVPAGVSVQAGVSVLLERQRKHVVLTGVGAPECG